MTQPTPTIPADVRERIIAAADQLYEQTGRQDFPTVGAVRQAARVDMNAASSVMREWRRQQTVQAAPVAVTVPEAVAQANGAALAALWQQAQELANESLQAAQLAWDAERAELDGLRQELADAYEGQAQELEAVKAQAAEAAQAAQEAATQAAQELAAVREELARAKAQAEAGREALAEHKGEAAQERKAQEEAHRAVVAGLKAEAAEARKALETQIQELRRELEAVKAQAEAAREATTQAATQHREALAEHKAEAKALRTAETTAREAAARLAGQLEELRQQHAGLLAQLAPAGKGKAGQKDSKS